MKKSKTGELKLGSAYFEGLPSSHIYGHYKNGVFIDSDTDKPLVLAEGAYVRITVANFRIPEELVPFHIEKKPWTVDVGNKFYFDMWIADEMRRFTVHTNQAICFTQEGNKQAKVKNSACLVFQRERLNSNELRQEDIQAKSFNEAFRLVSIKYRAGTSSHSCNVYREFRDVEKKRTLDDWRNMKH
jgi:hypothetical protein